MKTIKQLILNIIINGGILFIIHRYIPELGFSVTSSGFGILATFGILGFIFWVVNAVIKQILEVLTLPIKFLTFGISSFILNIAIFYLFSYIVEASNLGIQVQIGNILQVILMSIVITVIYFLVRLIIK